MTKEEEKIAEKYGEAPKLDLSAIKNVKADESNLSDDFKAKIKESNKKAQKSKFCFTEETEVNIPTGGFLYQDADDEDIKKGIVRLQPMTMADEETLGNQSYAKNGTTFIHLLNDCMLNNFDARRFNPYDAYYLLYQLREISYGNDYKFKLVCPECGKEYEYNLDITEAEFESFEEEDDIGQKTIKFPVSKYTATINPSSLGDDEEIKKMSKSNDFGELATRYAIRTVQILDNKGKPVNPRDYAEFYSALPGRDRAEITKAFKKLDQAKIPVVKVTCPKCGKEDEQEIPMTLDFFRL